MKRSPLAILFLTVFIDLLGFGIIIPLQPFYAKHLGADGFMVGMLSASYSFAQFLFSPIWGRLSDRIGRRPVLRFSMVMQALGFFIFGYADSLPLLFVARILAGVGGANISTAQAYIADVTPPEGRAKGMGLIGAAFGLGFVLGPALAGILAKAFNPSVPAYVAGALSLLNFLVASRFLPESLKVLGKKGDPQASRGELFAQGLKVPRLGLLWFVFFCNTFAFAAFEPTFALYANWRFNFDEAHTGYVFAFVGVIIAIMQGGVVGRLVKKVGEEPLVLAGIVCLGVALLLLPYAPTVPSLTADMGLLAIGNALIQPTITSLVSKASPFEYGGVLGVNQGLGSLARAGGPPLGGKLFDLSPTHGAPFLTAAAILLFSLVVSVIGFRRFPEALRVPGKEPSPVPVD